MLKILEFIKENKDWEDLLSQEPYYVNVTKDIMFGHNLAIFSYNQINSDFNNELVRECRGLIIDLNTLEPISVPFFKFGNYGEEYCPIIDWKSAKILTKVDGSLIKIVNLDGHLLISTNGTIDADKASLTSFIDCPFKSYKELVLNAYPIKGLSEEYLLNIFQEGYTYMFELTSLYNKVVIPYDGIRLTFIGIRNNKTLQEEYIKEHPLAQMFPTPKEFGFTNLDDCINAAKELPYTDEGYVVLDKNFNRIKVKSPAYVAIHHLKGEGILTKKKLLDLIIDNELDEFINYFPEYKNFAYKTLESYKKLCVRLKKDWEDFMAKFVTIDRKEIAKWNIENSFYPVFIFSKLDYSPETFFKNGKVGRDTIYSLLEKIIDEEK